MIKAVMLFFVKWLALDYQKVVKCLRLYAQEIPINKDAKRLSINKSSCLNATEPLVWFRKF
jgi:hypothetical protein